MYARGSQSQATELSADPAAAVTLTHLHAEAMAVQAVQVVAPLEQFWFLQRNASVCLLLLGLLTALQRVTEKEAIRNLSISCCPNGSPSSSLLKLSVFAEAATTALPELHTVT